MLLQAPGVAVKPRHCEPTGRREAPPDDRLREAIHRATMKNGLLRFARNDVAPIADTTPRSRGAMRPRRCLKLPPTEGVGNAGCPLHPQPRVHLVLVESTRATTSTPERPAFPHAMVLTAYVVLSPVTGLVCHRRQRIEVLSKPGWADAT